MPIAATRALVAAGARQLVDWLPHVAHDPTHALTSSITPAWYLSPEQHIWEFIALNIVLGGLVWVFGAKPWVVQVPAAAVSVSPAASAAAPPPPRRTWLDIVTCIICIVLAVVVAVYKALTDRKMYLLQPCHMQLFCLIYLSLNPGRPLAVDKLSHNQVHKPDTPSVVFNFYLHAMFGAWLALLMPDTRDLRLPGEVFTFFAEHAVLVALPLWYIARRRYNMFAPRVLHLWALAFLYHVNVLLPVSLLAGGNINYMLVPPGGPLRLLREHYRIGMGALCIALAFVMRRGIAGTAMALMTRLSPAYAAAAGKPPKHAKAA